MSAIRGAKYLPVVFTIGGGEIYRFAGYDKRLTDYAKGACLLKNPLLVTGYDAFTDTLSSHGRPHY